MSDSVRHGFDAFLDGCDCPRCLAAHTQMVALLPEPELDAFPHIQPLPVKPTIVNGAPHGYRPSYRAGCRCALCRKFQSGRMKVWRQRKAFISVSKILGTRFFNELTHMVAGSEPVTSPKQCVPVQVPNMKTIGITVRGDGVVNISRHVLVALTLGRRYPTTNQIVVRSCALKCCVNPHHYLIVDMSERPSYEGKAIFMLPNIHDLSLTLTVQVIKKKVKPQPVKHRASSKPVKSQKMSKVEKKEPEDIQELTRVYRHRLKEELNASYDPKFCPTTKIIFSSRAEAVAGLAINSEVFGNPIDLMRVYRCHLCAHYHHATFRARKNPAGLVRRKTKESRRYYKAIRLLDEALAAQK